MSAITARSMTAMSDQDRSSASPAAASMCGAPAGFSPHRRSGDGLQAVIPGWSEGPDPESRDSGFALRAPRNDVCTKQKKRPASAGLFVCCSTLFSAVMAVPVIDPARTAASEPHRLQFDVGHSSGDVEPGLPLYADRLQRG